MFNTPNYQNPSIEEYRSLLDYEAYLVQCVELLHAQGQLSEARYVQQVKKHATIRRKCMKAALKHKKAANAATLTA